MTLENDRHANEGIRRIVHGWRGKSGALMIELVDSFKSWIEQAPEIDDAAGELPTAFGSLRGQLVGGALARVDWLELAQHWNQTIDG